MDAIFLVGAVLGILSVLVGAWQVRLDRIALEEDRRERTAQRELHRSTQLAALRSELQAIRQAAEIDLGEYRGNDLSNPRVVQGVSGLALEGEVRHRLGFP